MNTDKDGNKIAEPKVDPIVKSANNRQKAMQGKCSTKASDAKPQARCPECGFHIRSKGHTDGAHHKAQVATMARRN